MHLFHFENNWTLCILVLAIGVIIIRYHLASTQIIQNQHIFYDINNANSLLLTEVH